MLPPTIPTSFVPHSASATTRRYRASISGLEYGAYGILVIVLVLALGVFIYGRILSAQESAKSAALTKAQSAIDPATIAGFVRLRDRLVSSRTLLDRHFMLSNFFSILSSTAPSSVRFLSLNVTLQEEGTVALEGNGVAKNFNALAATSNAFATEGRIKDAIFSHIVVSPRDSSVSFSLSATLDPKLVEFTASALQPPPPEEPPLSDI
ncbi:hypothetical protein HYV30_00875 [Candidatus Kaiserbacteria bacterium]|nr:hypothetical protein [Candidatus Kaiserbacteria bacterium]